VTSRISGLFWFPEGWATAEPKLSAAKNLTSSEVAAPGFHYSLGAVLRTQESNQPQRGGRPSGEKAPEDHRVHSILCIPLKFQEAVHGVLYFDNSCLEDAVALSTARP
jgi:transcriptional regulator with GAF, ATPase, and Fis domain